MGAEGTKLPIPEEEISAFREWLYSPVVAEKAESKERVVLLKALGLRD